MQRRTFLGGLAAAPAVRAATRRPNIVFVIADDLRFDMPGCAGHPFAKTPHLDRLAKEGARFDNFFCTTPLCSPSRASFLTGLYAHAHRIVNNDDIGHAFVSHTLMTWPRLLREAGYETAFIGKWHMGPDPTRRPGFDRWLSFVGQGIYIDPVVHDESQARQLTGYMTDYLNQQAVEFIRRKRSRPFVLYLSQKAVHLPYLPAKRHENLYAGARPAYPAVPPGDIEGKPAMTRKLAPVDILRLQGAIPEPAEPRRGRGRDRDSVVLDQLRCLASVDDGMGMIYEALERQGALDDTVIVFAGDNGYLLGEHGQFDLKRWAYEESIRIPFLMRYPRLLAPGRPRGQTLLNIDVAPTMLELAGVEWPERLHGRSFVPVLRDERAASRDRFFAEYFVEKGGQRCPDWQAIRTDRWKYIRYPTLDNMDEIYNLAADPREERNLIAAAESRGIIEEMRRDIARTLKDTPRNTAF